MTAAVERVLATALAFEDFTEQGGENAGQVVERMLKGVGLVKGQPWCAAYVYHVGFNALRYFDKSGSLWGLPKTGGCAVLGDFATKRGILEATPQVGDVFLIYFDNMHRFAHTGFILADLGGGRYRTIEGNTSGGGSREGWGVFVRERTFKTKDRFVRWTKLMS